MCGRFARYQPLADFAEALGEEIDPDLLALDGGPRYNIPPGTNAWTAAFDVHGELALLEQKWNFPTSRGNRINVRSETAHRVPEYREHFDKHRCVVLASGFYEPKGEKTTKNRPWYFFRPKDEVPLFLGAIAKEEGFSILTRAPVEPVASIHDRTPIMVPADCVQEFLDPDVSGRDALGFAPPAFGERLDCWRVGDAAKRPGNEGPELIEALNTSGGLFG